MIVFPNAKINLGLNVIEKRLDGFHDIQTVFYPISLTDILEVIVNADVSAKGVSFSSSGVFIPGDANGNLCVKAYDIINKDYELPAIEVFLQKIIPVGAGLGGGSADGAFFIKLINDLFKLGLNSNILYHYASQLGSDCSFFISNQPSYAIGKGDDLQPINISLKGFQIILVKPDIHIGTAEAYAGIVPVLSEISLGEQIINTPLENWKNTIKNDFESTIFPKYPLLGKIKSVLYDSGAIYASMSGSGSSIYGIFKDEVDLADKFRNCFVWAGKLD